MLDQYIQKRYLGEKVMMALRSRLHVAKPFPHLVLHDFFIESTLHKIARALRGQEFARQESDLFSFSQTKDLALLSHPDLVDFYRFMQSWEFKDYLQSITEIAAFGTVDCSGFLYQEKDYLLPHDDHLETRKIAYTIHLGKDFSRRDGGALDIFSGTRIMMSYPPHFNTLTLFPVHERVTLHQVNEVITNAERYSLSGWFHAE